jgi:uncharacterized repeat protein (TIGR04138 family)
MEKINFSKTLDQIVREDSRYPRDAYLFVREGLDFTLKTLRKDSHGVHRHVTGQELLDGLRRYALQQFGPLTKMVLNHWNVHRCEDFAEVVFNMVAKGILGKSEQDHPDDFKGGYDFDEAFVKPFQPARRPSHRHHAAPESHASRHVSRPRRRANSKKLSSGPN